MQPTDKDTNPWSGTLDHTEQNTHGSEPESQPTEIAPDPSPQSAPPDPVQPKATATSETPPPVQVPRETERPVVPQLASLRALFPDFDDAVLQYVLESVRGDQDRAIDTLLGMNDPNYVSTEQPQALPVLSQTDLDEQFARRLMLEEEQANWEALQQQQRAPPRQREPIPYEARVHQQPPGGGEKDTMTEIQEQLGKIAESGKKTFGNLLSKVKAKMQEFDQPKSPQGSSSGGTEPRWGSGSGGNSYQYDSPARQYSFYDPYRPASPSVQHHQGYDATPHQGVPSSAPSQPLPQVPILEPIAKSEPLTLTTGETTTRSPQGGGNPSSNIDPGKLGLLPKRPVSLLKPQSPSTEATPKAHEDDDDDLEYAENPFEEGHT